MRPRIRYAWIYASYGVAAAAVALCFIVDRIVSASRHAYRTENLAAEYAAWGIDAEGTKEFVPLPKFVPYDLSAASVGEEMFRCRSAGPGSRSCISCHPLNEGGADGKLHSGVFTRPAKNAVFGKAYLQDGSAPDFKSLVKAMIEDRKFIGAGTLSNAVEALKLDGRMRRRFEACYGEEGLADTNIVNAIEHYCRTLTTANGPFDRFCGGRDSLSPDRLAGFGHFKKRKCARCHSGPSLGTRVVTDDGKRVPSLRGLSKRRVYQAGGSLYTDLAAAVAMMPDSDFGEDEKARLCLLDFLGCL